MNAELRRLLAEYEQRFLEGDARALRAVVRQAGPATLDLPFQGVELRSASDGGGLTFTGYASVVDAPYEMSDWLGSYTEVIRSGAFRKTLSEDPDVVFVLNHDWSAAPMARTKPGTMRLAEDSTGLHVEADLDATRADVNILRSAMERGELDAMSFAFWVTRQTWSPDYDQRDIHEVMMNGGDASVVTFPANPATTGTTALRKRAAEAVLRTRVPTLVAQELRAGKALSQATLDTLQQVLDLVASADADVDEAQEVLSTLMGVPNPDVDDASAQSNSGPHPADVRARLRLQASR